MMSRWRALSIRTVLLLTVSLLTLLIIVLSGRTVLYDLRKMNTLQGLAAGRMLSVKLFALNEALSRERELGYILLRESTLTTLPNLSEDLELARRTTDEAWGIVQAGFNTYSRPELLEPYAHMAARMKQLPAQRKEVDLGTPTPNNPYAQEWFDETNITITTAQDLWLVYSRYFSRLDGRISHRILFNHLLGMNIETISRERSLVTALLAAHVGPTTEEQSGLLRWQGATDMGWRLLQKMIYRGDFSPEIQTRFDTALANYQQTHARAQQLLHSIGDATQPYSANNVREWYEQAQQLNSHIQALKATAFEETRQYLESLTNAQLGEIKLHVIMQLIALLICAYSYYVIIYRVTTPIQRMINALLETAHGRANQPMPALANHGDEIGKLGEVMHTLHERTQEVQRAAVMLQQYTQDLERSNKELDDFAYIASHDLKEPLRGIYNHAFFLLEDNEGKLDADSVGRLHRLIHLSKRMETLVNDLLYFSRIGRQDLAIRETDLNEVVADVADTIDSFLAENHATITIPRKIPLTVCDKVRVTELLRNLLTNAVKYNDSPEKRIEVGHLPQHMHPNGELLHDVFYVEDNGRGIAPEFKDEVFRIFRRLQTSAADGSDGTGVGLTFVKKIVERHGGTIWLNSQPGKGTTFYFTLKGNIHGPHLQS